MKNTTDTVENTADSLRILQEQFGKPDRTQHPCPACGYCPCCGRRRNDYWEWPHIWPTYPPCPTWPNQPTITYKTTFTC